MVASMILNERINIAIVGSGIIGKQLAIFFAIKKFKVILVSRNERATEIAHLMIREKLKRLSGQEDCFSNITFSSNIFDIKDAILVIEAVNENIEIKKKVLLNIDSFASEEAIIGSNTSSISIEELSENLSKKENFLGIHFFNPVAKMQLVEIIRSSSTSQEIMESVKEFLIKNDKYPIIMGDSPGFIVNRILMPLINEASILFEEGQDPKIIDDAIKLGLNHPMGPLELADLIGLDICIQIMENISMQKKDEKYLPSDILRRLVGQGKLGKKSGIGFHAYLSNKI